MNLGYIRVSTFKQDLKNQKSAILEFANSKKWVVDKFIKVEVSSQKSAKKRKLEEIFQALNKGDKLIITELSRLGRSVSEVMEIVNTLIEKGVHLISIKENIDLKERHSLQSKVMITMFSLFAELERDLISQRTKEALAAKKAKGVKLGRPRGIGKSRLDPFKEEIQKFLDKDVSMLSISKILEVSYPTLFNFIKKHGMLKASQKAQKKKKKNSTKKK